MKKSHKNVNLCDIKSPHSEKKSHENVNLCDKKLLHSEKKNHENVNFRPSDKTQTYFQVYEYQQGC